MTKMPILHQTNGCQLKSFYLEYPHRAESTAGVCNLYVLLWNWTGRLKVEVGEFDLYDFSKVTDERVQHTVDVGRVRLRVIDRNEGTLRLTEALVDQALTSCRQQSLKQSSRYSCVSEKRNPQHWSP